MRCIESRTRITALFLAALLVSLNSFRAAFPSNSMGVALAESRVSSVPSNVQYVTHKRPPRTNATGASPANRSVVILIGGLRAGEPAWRTLYDHVLDPNSADLLLMTSARSAYPNSSLYDRARYVWHYHQFEDWADAVDLVRGTGWRTTHLPRFQEEVGRNRSILFGGLRGHDRASGVIIFMIRYFLMGALRDAGLLDAYDRFVVTRTDHYYLCPHLFSSPTCRLGAREVIVPDGEEYNGVTDRHLIASRATLLDALDLITPLITEPYAFDPDRHGNSELYLKAAWADQGLRVRRCTRSMLTCAAGGDDTRWQAAGAGLPGVPGLFVKYEREHAAARDGCARFRRNSRPGYKGTCLKCSCGQKKKDRRDRPMRFQ